MLWHVFAVVLVLVLVLGLAQVLAPAVGQVKLLPAQLSVLPLLCASRYPSENRSAWHGS